MEIEVVSFVAYPSRPPWSKADRYAVDFIRAVKSKDAKLVGPRRLDTAEADRAVEWFGTMAALALKNQHLRRPILLIPVPSSDCCCETDGPPRTLPLALAIADRINGAILFDALRWRQRCKPTHRGGIRKAKALYDNLVLATPLPQATPVLVDDVLTTGAHIQAAAARVSTRGQHCVYAICVGMSVRSPLTEAFCIFRRKLASPPWAADCV